jgi:hypothetical protein
MKQLSNTFKRFRQVLVFTILVSIFFMSINNYGVALKIDKLYSVGDSNSKDSSDLPDNYQLNFSKWIIQ